jgi:hypothetical protein
MISYVRSHEYVLIYVFGNCCGNPAPMSLKFPTSRGDDRARLYVQLHIGVIPMNCFDCPGVEASVSLTTHDARCPWQVLVPSYRFGKIAIVSHTSSCRPLR